MSRILPAAAAAADLASYAVAIRKPVILGLACFERA
jgi:hypothetical protein